jgi:hypothetical protein
MTQAISVATSATPFCQLLTPSMYYSMVEHNGLYMARLFCSTSDCSDCMLTFNQTISMDPECRTLSSDYGNISYKIYPSSAISITSPIVYHKDMTPEHIMIAVAVAVPVVVLIVLIVLMHKCNGVQQMRDFDHSIVTRPMGRGACAVGTSIYAVYARIRDFFWFIGVGVHYFCSSFASSTGTRCSDGWMSLRYFSYYWSNVVVDGVKRVGAATRHKLDNTELLYLVADADDVVAFQSQKPLVYKTTLCLLLCTSVSFIVHVVLWKLDDPFQYFTSAAFSKVGLTSQYLRCINNCTHD